MKNIYDKLEPKKFTRLEMNDFKGVMLNYDDCVLITRKLVELELKVKNNVVSGVVTNRTFTKGQKVKVLVGCVWQNAKVEDYHPDPKYYLCGTNSWSTHFHENSIKAV